MLQKDRKQEIATFSSNWCAYFSDPGGLTFDILNLSSCQNANLDGAHNKVICHNSCGAIMPKK